MDEPQNTWSAPSADLTSTPLPAPDSIVIPGPAVVTKRSKGRTIGLLVGVGVLIAAVVVGVSLVGKDDGPAFSLPVAAESAADISTISYEMDMEMGSVASTHMEGVQDVAGKRMSMTMTLAGKEVSYVYDVAANTIYMDAAALGVPTDKQWVSMDIETTTGIDVGALAQQADSNPLSIAPMLATADGVEDLGREQLDGVEVEHYRVTIDVAEAMKAQPGVFGGLDETVKNAMPDSIDYDVFVTEGNLLRRMSFSMPIVGQTVTVTVDIVGINEPVDIEIPSAEDTVSFDDLLGN